MSPQFVLSACLSVLTIFGFAFFAVISAQLVAWFAKLELDESDRKFLKWTLAFVVVEAVLIGVTL